MGTRAPSMANEGILPGNPVPRGGNPKGPRGKPPGAPLPPCVKAPTKFISAPKAPQPPSLLSVHGSPLPMVWCPPCPLPPMNSSHRGFSPALAALSCSGKAPKGGKMSPDGGHEGGKSEPIQKNM